MQLSLSSKIQLAQSVAGSKLKPETAEPTNCLLRKQTLLYIMPDMQITPNGISAAIVGYLRAP